MKTDKQEAMSDLKLVKWNVALKCIIVGIIAGMLAVLYRFGIGYGLKTAIIIYHYIRLHPYMIPVWLILIVLAGVFIGWLVRLEPMASGSGIPQTEGVVLYSLKMKWYSVLAVRYIGGILCSVFGLSLGREGPSIQIGAAGAELAAAGLSNDPIQENCLITGGAAAGLSAAFNAPISGMIFAIEEVHHSFSPLILLSAATASLTADLVSKAFFGLRPVLDFVKIPQLPIRLYLWLIPIGIISGFTGSLINKSLLGFQTLYNRLPILIRPCVALLTALPVGLLLPQILGGGQNLIELCENGQNIMALFLLLFLAKIIFTAASFGSGVPGGIFMPILSVGALAGSISGMFAVHVGLPSQYIPVFIVCSMAGALSGSVKAPVTSVMLITEMAGSIMHLFPVAACSIIALLVSDLLNVKPIYEELLERYAKSNSLNLIH